MSSPGDWPEVDQVSSMALRSLGGSVVDHVSVSALSECGGRLTAWLVAGVLANGWRVVVSLAAEA